MADLDVVQQMLLPACYVVAVRTVECDPFVLELLVPFQINFSGREKVAGVTIKFLALMFRVNMRFQTRCV